eukprot:TRINITY_DN1968_c0_g1_i1.p1 TRINITY_DN1968_c0_g1~~TRINITY_DN1968_c0_g1_i1.p1  ORF type:complete len:386 (+),score=93.85 TRINITY_DN1968_c0_g1_i1:168-1160(+)
MVEVIGEGAYGMVCTCRDKKKGKLYAIKFLEIEEDEDEYLQKEIEILKEADQCPFVVRYFGAYMKDDTLMLVMEYCDGGSAFDILNARGITFTEDQVAAICACVTNGLAYLHANRIIHRDLKAGNILLTSDGLAKLADFGASTKLMHSLQKTASVVGSPYWIAPEVITQKDRFLGYDNKADIWSQAITAIELAEGQPPHFSLPSMKVIFIIPKQNPPRMTEPSKWSSEMNDFIATCLQKSPTDRPSAKALLEHPFIKKGTSTGQQTLKSLVLESLPLLEKMRADKKKGEESSGTFSARFSEGSTISIHRGTGTVKISGSSSNSSSSSYND